jgi:hypothetical protein
LLQFIFIILWFWSLWFKFEYLDEIPISRFEKLIWIYHSLNPVQIQFKDILIPWFWNQILESIRKAFLQPSYAFIDFGPKTIFPAQTTSFVFLRIGLVMVASLAQLQPTLTAVTSQFFAFYQQKHKPEESANSPSPFLGPPGHDGPSSLLACLSLCPAARPTRPLSSSSVKATVT